MTDIYDVVIIGSGPAGLSAGLYAARARLKTLIIEKEKAGGQIVTTDEVANYPGSIENATGPSLITRMVEQADEFGAERILDTIREVELDGKIKVLKGKRRISSKDSYYCNWCKTKTNRMSRRKRIYR